MTSWHTVSTAPGKSIVAERGLFKLGVEVYSPRRLTRVGWLTVDVPWLGSLILARWDGADPHTWHDVRDLPGVSAILGGWPPWSISDGDVDRFRARIDELTSGAVVHHGPPPCAVGDEVVFNYLAFHQMTARCLWVGGGVVGVRIRMLGHDHMLQVPYEFVGVVDRGVRARFLGRPRR